MSDGSLINRKHAFLHLKVVIIKQLIPFLIREIIKSEKIALSI